MKLYSLTVLVNYSNAEKEAVHGPANIGAIEDIVDDYLSDDLATSFVFTLVPHSNLISIKKDPL